MILWFLSLVYDDSDKVNYNFDKVAEKFLSKLKHFNRVSMSISIDDYDKRNTYIRSLSNWNLTIKNLKSIPNEDN